MSQTDILSSARVPEPRRNLLAIVLSIVAVLAVIIGGVVVVGGVARLWRDRRKRA